MNIFKRSPKPGSFYSHLASLETITLEIDKLSLAPEQKDHLKTLAHTSIHHLMINTVLSEVSADDKKQFLRLLAEDDHQNIRKMLQKQQGLETKIHQEFASLEKEILRDLR